MKSSTTSRTIEITGMAGEACVKKVSEAIKNVNDVSVQSIKVGAATLECDQAGCDAACEAINAAGYKARPQTQAGKPGDQSRGASNASDSRGDGAQSRDQSRGASSASESRGEGARSGDQSRGAANASEACGTGAKSGSMTQGSCADDTAGKSSCGDAKGAQPAGETASSKSNTSRTIEVQGMTGEVCVKQVASALKGVPNVSVRSVEVGQVVIEADKSGCIAACAAINSAGYKARESAGIPQPDGSTRAAPKNSGMRTEPTTGGNSTHKPAGAGIGSNNLEVDAKRDQQPAGKAEAKPARSTN